MVWRYGAKPLFNYQFWKSLSVWLLKNDDCNQWNVFRMLNEKFQALSNDIYSDIVTIKTFSYLGFEMCHRLKKLMCNPKFDSLPSHLRLTKCVFESRGISWCDNDNITLCNIIILRCWYLIANDVKQQNSTNYMNGRIWMTLELFLIFSICIQLKTSKKCNYDVWRRPSCFFKCFGS